MDSEEYEKIFGYLSDKKYPNDKSNHGGEVWHVLNICVFLKPN